MARQAAFGFLVWGLSWAMAFAHRSPWWIIEQLFLLAPLVLIPLALDVIEPPERLRALRVVQPMAALGVMVSFLLPSGPVAGLWAAGWLGVALPRAFRGFVRLRACGARDAAEVALAAAPLFLPVGAGWLVLSRLGATPLGFEEPIVLLTAVHFHYAGFIALTLVGRAGRATPHGPAYRAIVGGVIAGTPLLAAGITLSRPLEVMGTTVLASALVGFSGWSLRQVVPRVADRGTRVLLTLSAGALPVAMGLALLYAWGHGTGQVFVSLSTLARVHGPLNAVGFGLIGLLAWARVPRHPDARLL